MGDRDAKHRALNRHFAWLEFEDTRDGVAFSTAFDDMGWTNLFTYLRLGDDGAGHKAYFDANRDLVIRVLSGSNVIHSDGTRGVEQGALWTPGDTDGFNQSWIVNPGVQALPNDPDTGSPRGTLVFGGPGSGSGEDDAHMADLLVISGHGAMGKVGGTKWGTFAGNHGTREWDVAGLLAQTLPKSSGALKYLILPACTIAGGPFALMWLPAFQLRPTHPAPAGGKAKQGQLRGILGYGQAYSGDESGAIVMRDFAKLLSPKSAEDEKTILQCWAEANQKAGLSWSAVMMFEAAKDDKMSQWVKTEGLPDIVDTSEVRQYDAINSKFPIDASSGSRVTAEPPEFEARWHLSKRFDAIDNFQRVGADAHPGNNDNILDPQLGLDPGRAGILVLSSKSGKFEAGTTMALVFYMYRQTHSEVELDKLITPWLTASQHKRFKKIVDANPAKKVELVSNKYDGFYYTFDEDEAAAGRAEIYFQVVQDAPDFYKDRSFAHSCGVFWIDVLPPKKMATTELGIPPFGPVGDGGAIRNFNNMAIHMAAHGVHLHFKKDKSDERTLDDALAQVLLGGGGNAPVRTRLP